MAAITICSDVGAPQNKVWCFGGYTMLMGIWHDSSEPEPALRSWLLLGNQRNMVALRGLPPSTVVFNFLSIFFLFLAVLGCRCCALLPLVAESGVCSLLSSQASHCCGFSCWRARALHTQASVAAEPAECRLSGCGERASLLWGLQNLLRPGMQPTYIARQILNRWTTSEASPPTLNKALFVCCSYAWLLSGLFVGSKFLFSFFFFF